ncbi:conjugal transfer protein TraI [Streptosporangium saharense]|uniref:Conjugal transfer protein TraI n=1 Tax=Streptosporangium saharense TaxID=1706840 RepID=A0A7W7VPE0_9ACTN|nr:conjugal transfer protein TraI [Streptosporangium saharense]MBB4917414.1 hypothetical protein [Streptosporangium saharense]
MTTMPVPDPSPEEVTRGIAALERHLAAQAPPAPPSEPVLARPTDPPSGETKRVRQLRQQVAEAHALAVLQDDDAPLTLDTDKVRKRRRAAHEAARLYELAQAPAMQIYQTVRVRRLLVIAAMLALTLALAWSTAGVQKFAADGAAAGSPAWIFAWLVEPFMSMALLVVVGARAYLGTRGTMLNHPTVIRIEWLFLGLTATMNAWPYLPGIAETFSMAALVLHLLGPVVAVAIVTVLPIILAAFAGMNHTPHTAPPSATPQGADQRWRRDGGGAEDPPSETGRGRTPDEHRAELRRLIASGQLPAVPSARAIQNALRCREDLSRTLRDELRNP